jgi:hypothetical protein
MSAENKEAVSRSSEAAAVARQGQGQGRLPPVGDAGLAVSGYMPCLALSCLVVPCLALCVVLYSYSAFTYV